jgi:hypothetical protein
MAEGYTADDIAELEAAYEATIDKRGTPKGREAYEAARDKLVPARQAFRLAEEAAGRRVPGVPAVEED